MRNCRMRILLSVLLMADFLQALQFIALNVDVGAKKKAAITAGSNIPAAAAADDADALRQASLVLIAWFEGLNHSADRLRRRMDDSVVKRAFGQLQDKEEGWLSVKEKLPVEHIAWEEAKKKKKHDAFAASDKNGKAVSGLSMELLQLHLLKVITLLNVVIVITVLIMLCRRHSE